MSVPMALPLYDEASLCSCKCMDTAATSMCGDGEAQDHHESVGAANGLRGPLELLCAVCGARCASQQERGMAA